MVFKNEAQLKKFLMSKCAKAVDNTKEKVYAELANNLHEFYHEFSPEEYIRTGALYNSLEVTGVRQVGNQHMSRAEAEVWFDTPEYRHGIVPLQSGGYGFSSWSDEKIQNVVMNDGLPHGHYEEGTPIWKESMRNLGGKQGIRNLLKQELKKQGL